MSLPLSLGYSPSLKKGTQIVYVEDLNGSIPTFVHLIEAYKYDSRIMDRNPVELNAYYLFDKGYIKLDFRYTHFHQKHVWFVTRAKDNMKYEVLESR